MLIREVLAILRRWLWLIVLCTVAGAALAYWQALRVTPTYEGDAGVVVVRQSTQVKLEPRFETSLTNEINLTDRDQTGLHTLASLATSEAIAQTVFNDINGALPDRIRTPTDLVRLISSEVRNGVIRIKARSNDPELAARLANLWAQRYAEYVNHIYAGQATAIDLIAQVDEAQQRYEGAQEALVAFMAEDPSAQLNTELSDKNGILNRLLQLRADGLAGELERAYNRRQLAEGLLNDAQVLRRLLSESDSTAADAANTLALLALQFYAVDSGYTQAPLGDDTNTATSTRASGIQFNFNPQRLDDISVTSADLLNDLDNLIATLEERLQQYEAEIEQLSQAALTSATAASDPAVQQLYTDIADLRAQLATLDGRRQQLQSERDRLWESYNLLSNASQEVLLTASTSDGTVTRFAIPALIPGRPIQAPATQSLITGAFIGLMVGIFLAFGLELIDNKVRNRADVEEVLELPVLGLVPKGRVETDGRPVALVNAHAPVVEGVRFLRSAVEAAAPPVHSLLITSVNRGEGKSAIAANLAIVSAAAGRSVILIDANFRNPQLHRLFDLPNRFGLSDILDDPDQTLADRLQPTTIPQLRVLTAGSSADQAADWLVRPTMHDVLVAAMRQADLVLIDSSAAKAFTESQDLAGEVDAVLLVLRSGASSVPDIRQVQHDIASSSGRLLGVALNRTRSVRNPGRASRSATPSQADASPAVVSGGMVPTSD